MDTPAVQLQPDPSYPADFSVDYPARLRGGVVLIKWWLLALFDPTYPLTEVPQAIHYLKHGRARGKVAISV